MTLLDTQRYWLLTWTTYGTWLPGDCRGFVGSTRDGTGRKSTHNDVNTPYDRDTLALRKHSYSQLKCPPILVTTEQAQAAIEQFRETAEFRGWRLLAVSVMKNHVHTVVGADTDVRSAKILGDLKSYASRTLNRRWTKPVSGTWWTESGSRRPLRSEKFVYDAIEYVLNQQHPLAVWSDENV